MEKKQVYNWIEKIIETCTNDFHYKAVEKLIILFQDKYQDAVLTQKLIRSKEEHKSYISFLTSHGKSITIDF